MISKVGNILCVCSIFLISNINATVYWAQLKSSDKKEVLLEDQEKLHAYAMPFSIVNFDKKGVMYYRLRMGPFSDSTAAFKVSTFLGFKYPWIVADTTSSYNRLKKSLRTIDSIPAFPKIPQYYVSNKKTFFALYVNHYGMEGTIMPAKIIIYFNNSPKKLTITNITGFCETDSSIKFGKPTLLAKDPSGAFENNYNFKRLFERYQKLLGNSSLNLSYYNDSSEVYINILSEYLFETRNEIIRNKQGFDYCDINGNCVNLAGRMDSKLIGNARLQTFTTNEVTLIQIANYMYYCKIDPNQEKLLILQIKNKE